MLLSLHYPLSLYSLPFSNRQEITRIIESAEMVRVNERVCKKRRDNGSLMSNSYRNGLTMIWLVGPLRSALSHCTTVADDGKWQEGGYRTPVSSLRDHSPSLPLDMSYQTWGRWMGDKGKIENEELWWIEGKKGEKKRMKNELVKRRSTVDRKGYGSHQSVQIVNHTQVCLSPSVSFEFAPSWEDRCLRVIVNWFFSVGHIPFSLSLSSVYYRK